MAFAGFPRETLAFLEGIAANNNKEWFTANRALYDATVEGARAFVEAVGPRLREVAPAIQYESKIGGSLPRINRDQRFAKDKPPYREEYDLWFWHGDKKGFEQPGFFVRITPGGVWVASGMMHILWPTLKQFREAVLEERSGLELERIVAAINAVGPYQVGYPRRKTVPKGFDPNAPRAEYLKYESLWGYLQLPADAVLKPDFGDVALAAWRDLAPIAEWLMAEVIGRTG
jgi:uncharacterized protein (TIGR02453 family)